MTLFRVTVIEKPACDFWSREGGCRMFKAQDAIGQCRYRRKGEGNRKPLRWLVEQGCDWKVTTQAPYLLQVSSRLWKGEAQST